MAADEQPGRLARIERKLDGINDELTRWRVQSEHRFTKLEATAKATARIAGAIAGFAGGLVGAIATAWISKHV